MGLDANFDDVDRAMGLEQLAEGEERTTLGMFVTLLMAKLQKEKDPRYEELLGIMVTARQSHPDYDPAKPTASKEAFQQGHLAVLGYIEARHRDLYNFVQTASRG